MKVIAFTNGDTILVEMKRDELAAASGHHPYDDVVKKVFDNKRVGDEFNVSNVSGQMQKVKGIPNELEKLRKSAVETLQKIEEAISAAKTLPILSQKIITE